MAESRADLLTWLNELLSINYTKIEQVGTGAAYCQIIDSIYGDVPMNKVKFDTKHEYEYVANYKILQNAFDKHKIDKSIPVERLLKCRLQDNLEFLQWLKKYWDQNNPGGTYEATSRRKGGPSAGAAASARSSGSSRAPATKKAAPAAPASRNPGRTGVSGGSGSGRPLSSNSGSGKVIEQASSAIVIDLNSKIMELKVTVEGLEKERDFYFGKLRDIEILVQQQLEIVGENAPESPLLKEIQNIMYSTEEGFEVPPEGAAANIEDETF